MKEIFRLSVLFRNENKSFNLYPNIQLDQKNIAKNLSKEKYSKLNIANITLPEVPSIIFELNDVIANPRSSADDIAKVVQKSPSLTVMLLKLVNSTFYSFPSKIDKISSAVILIGTKEMSGLALGISILTTFDKIPKKIVDMFQFLKHSFACGIIARMLATQKGIPHTEQFFVSGLLHDLSRLILYSNFPEDSHNILNLSRTTNKLLFEVERDCLGCNHSHIARCLIKQWNLPISLENNVSYHHNPSEAPQPVPATLVHLADIITNGLGSEAHLKEMGFEDKRALLQNLFGGTDKDGKRYGVYVENMKKKDLWVYTIKLAFLEEVGRLETGTKIYKQNMQGK